MNLADTFFVRLLQMTGRHVVVLEAYLDESERQQGKFCIAGYVFAPLQAKKFSKEWKSLFGDKGAHMVDLCAGRGQFKGIDVDERGNLLKAAVKIISSRMTLGFGVSCDVNEVDRLTPKFIVGWGHAYPICCHLAMAIIGSWMREHIPHERVTYTFEAGHRFAAEANRYLTHAMGEKELTEFYCYGGHAFLPKPEAVPLQAADLLAWEWTKFHDETFDKHLRPIRKSLRALMENNLKRYKMAHLKNESLAKYLSHVKNLGLLQLQEGKNENKP